MSDKNQSWYFDVADYTIRDPSNEDIVIADVADLHWKDSRTDIDILDNGYVLAASRDLLAVCERVLAGFGLLIAANDLTDDEREQVAQLRAAIAKARGVQ